MPPSSTAAASIVIPYGALSALTGVPFGIGFWIHVAPGADPDAVSAKIVDVFRTRYPGRADVAIDVPATAMASIQDEVHGIAHRLVFLLGAALALGTANVFQLIRFRLSLRRRELAVRRAIGASDAAVIRLGAAFGLVIGAFAATLGLAAGVLATSPLAGAIQMEVDAVSIRCLGIVFAVLLAAGAAAGAAAGWLARRGEPATALRDSRA
jgi:putative ABC transport system permease protein